jgi:hypothetical protein
MAGESY